MNWAKKCLWLGKMEFLTLGSSAHNAEFLAVGMTLGILNVQMILAQKKEE